MKKKQTSGRRPASRYSALIGKIFSDRYKPGDVEVAFRRVDIPAAAKALKITLPKNLGDVVYSKRYRDDLPSAILRTQPPGLQWIIEGRGRAKYAFKLVPVGDIVPNPSMASIKIPDSTPEIVGAYSLTDEQALLAKVRYNRLLDIFLGLTTYSLQNHLRTSVKNVGQVEIDELYVGIDMRGCQYILPMQAKGGADRLSVVQTAQDISFCAEKYPSLVCRAISAQFRENDLIAMFELAIVDGAVRIVQERHYLLVPSERISPSELDEYRAR